MTFQELCKSLEAKIISSYEEGITLEQAEKLAGEFLAAQFRVSEELTNLDLSSRMKKVGNKSVRAAAYLEIVQNSDKKPTEAMIAALIDTDISVLKEQSGQDKSEADRDELKRYYDIFLNSHIFFRGIARGGFNA